MYDPNTQNIAFHLKDIDRQFEPRLREYREPKARSKTLLRVISVIGLLVAAAPFVPWT
ncbi:hypothetical protein AB2B41_04415 [Marimonas sp. MJW-29]|uniref:Uncharacterized protein n=1 Tax=Sulfitobacter sediminis TaxID=3234186 RepID=A0ABV3RIN2_9RHOB